MGDEELEIALWRIFSVDGPQKWSGDWKRREKLFCFVLFFKMEEIISHLLHDCESNPSKFREAFMRKNNEKIVRAMSFNST